MINISNNYQNLFISGFVKAAESYGLSQGEISQLVKTSFYGPMAEMLTLGAPSGLGYLMGKHENLGDATSVTEEQDYYNRKSLGKALKYLMLPGYTGYRIGKRKNLDTYLRAAENAEKDKV
jgi:hypothetical protein